jgi:hypothetical protein
VNDSKVISWNVMRLTLWTLVVVMLIVRLLLL